MTQAPEPKRKPGRPPGSGKLPPGTEKTTTPIRFGPKDRENIALVKHLLDAKTDSEAVRRALERVAEEAGRHLSAEQRAQILAAAGSSMPAV
jgi:acyl-CoA reductase-like NAD-dependent aldehyde dehydrogenase